MIADAEEYLEIRADDETVCRWANETIDEAQTIMQKLDVIIETLTNLHDREVEADVLLSPAIDP